MSNGAEGKQLYHPAQAKREGFTTTFGAILATLGSAVGLGNIWKFPYLTGENGGAAFLITYIICVFFIGLPVMISEFIIGRKARSNAVGSYRKLSPGTAWMSAGWMGVTAAFLIMAFYTDVAGWVYSYVFKSAIGGLSGLNAAGTEAAFGNLVGSTVTPLIWQWIVLITIAMIIMAGVQKGIERMTRTLLPILFVLLLICDVRALTLPGAFEGLNFLFKPDFSKVTGAVILSAMGLAFFKLSVGMGTMTTYGSYMGDEDNITTTAVKVALSDTLVSILAGIAIFPAVFAFGQQPGAGTGLLFSTIPLVFNSMPFGSVILVLFFVLTAIAATGAMISLLEVPVAFFIEERKWARNKATIISILIMGGMGVLATLSTSVLAKTMVVGKTWFDLFDFASSNVLLPLGGLIICLFVGWKLGPQVIYQEASNNGTLGNASFLKVFTFVIRYIAPLAIIIVFLNSLGILTPLLKLLGL
ncbi:MAG: sodium-dependent transporter [Methylocystaceae bacterium]